MIQTRWVDREQDGCVTSRLVLKDFNREQECIQPEMFAPTPSTLSLQTLLAVRWHDDHHNHPERDYIAIALDVHAAFLHAGSDQGLFTEQPEESKVCEHEGWRQNKASCGYRKAPKLGHQHGVTLLESLNYHPLLTDPSCSRNNELDPYFLSC